MAAIPVSPAVTMSAGTELVLRIVETIETSQAMEAKSWAAVLARDVRAPDGALVIGAGSPIYLGVSGVGGALQLNVRSVVAKGNSYLASVPLTSSGNAVTGLEPWGPAGASAEIHLSGAKIFVPGQALISVKLGEPLTLR